MCVCGHIQHVHSLLPYFNLTLSHTGVGEFNHWIGIRVAGASLSNRDGNPYTIHSLRRSAANTWLNNGLNIHHVKILLGHDNLRTTIQYLNYDLADIQQTEGNVDFGLSD